MPIPTAAWDALVVALRNFEESDQACAVSDRLHKETTLQDVPRLMTLLQDRDAFVREAAAWPLSELVGVPALRDLLVAYQRGLDEGLDNDGFTAALIDLVQVHSSESALVLRSLAQNGDSDMQENALWLLEFCSVDSSGPTTPA